MYKYMIDLTLTIHMYTMHRVYIFALFIMQMPANKTYFFV